MNPLHIACTLALLTALGHSYLSERLFLRPLRSETLTAGTFSDDRAKRLVTAMFHLPSVFWVAMGVSLLVLQPGVGGYRETLQIYAAIYALSGVGNFWAVGKPHPGGILLLTTSALILIALYY